MSSGIPVTDEIQGNLNIRDFSGIGTHGNLLVEKNLTVNGTLIALTTSLAAAAGFKPAAPQATSSATLVMMGLGATVVYTPTATGKVRITCTGTGQTATAVANWTVGGRYGTGTAPNNGDAVTGTRWGAGADKVLRSAATATASDFSLTDLLTLTPGTAYWFDLALDTGNVSDAASLAALSFVLEEVI